MGLSCPSSKSSLVPNFRLKKDQNFLETWYYHICCFPGSGRRTHTDARSQARTHKGFHMEPCGVSVLPDAAAAAGCESSQKRRSGTDPVQNVPGVGKQAVGLLRVSIGLGHNLPRTAGVSDR